MRGAIVSVIDAGKASGLNEDSPGMKALWARAQAVQEAIAQLLLACSMPGTSSEENAVSLTAETKKICIALAGIIDPSSDQKAILEKIADVKLSVADMVKIGKTISNVNPQFKDGVVKAVLELVNSTKTLESASKNGHTPELEKACDIVRTAVEHVLIASGYESLAQGLKSIILGAAAKSALASTLALNCSVRASLNHVSNPSQRTSLLEAASKIPETIDALLKVLVLPHDELDKALLPSVNKFAPEAFRLVAGAKMAVPSVSDTKVKANLVHSSDSSATAIRNLVHQAKIFQPRGKATYQELVAVKNELQNIATEISKALNDAKSDQLERFTVGVEQIRENAFKTLNTYGRGITASAAKLQYMEFDEFPKEFDNILSQSKKIIGVIKGLAGTTDNKDLQIELLSTGLKVIQQIALLLSAASKNDHADLEAKGTAMEEMLQNLVTSGRQIIVHEMELLQSKQQVVVQDVAERELIGAANVINDALKKIMAAQEAARKKASVSGVKLEEGINDKILENARIVVQAASDLIATATEAQREINGNNPQSRSPNQPVYRRDPKWEQGLISAAKAVAGSVQYLVRSANETVSG